jgi:hypothetical protein
MASKYSIEAVFRLIDQVSGPTSKIGRELNMLSIQSKTLSNALKNDFDKAASRLDRLGQAACRLLPSVKRFSQYAVAGSPGAVDVGVGIATKQFVEFDSQLYKAGSIFSDLNPGMDDFTTKIDLIGKEVRKVAATTEFNTEQTALVIMAIAGIKSGQAISLLPKVADIAAAAGLELDQVVGMAADSLNVFRKMTDDPIKLAENLQYVSDIMVKTVNIANMDLSLLWYGWCWRCAIQESQSAYRRF